MLVEAVYAGVLIAATSVNPTDMLTLNGVQRAYTTEAVVLTSWLHLIATSLPERGTSHWPVFRFRDP